MSVAHIEKTGFWTSLWHRVTGRAPIIDQFAKDTSGRVPAPPMIEIPVRKPVVAIIATVPRVSLMPVETVVSRQESAKAPEKPRPEFRLAARLASTQSLNAPKLRDGKAPVTPRESKPVAAGRKAKPKATVAVVKKSIPQRHVWLSSRPPAAGAEIVRFVPSASRQCIKRAA